MQPVSEPAPAATMPPASVGGGVSKWLSVVALVLAIAALAVTFIVPGPAGVNGRDGTAGATGPQGPTGTDGTNGVDGATGPQGPPGPGTVMAANAGYGGTIQSFGCTLSGVEVSITVPGPGTIVVEGSTQVEVSHGTGASDYVSLYVETGAACSNDAWTATMYVDYREPAILFDETLPVAHSFTVFIAGTYTFYISDYGMFFSSGGSGQVVRGELVAVYYPN